MARHSTHTDTLTFRLEPELKAVLAERAHEESKALGEVMRDLIRDFAEQERRRKFLAEAERQSLECARTASDQSSDEARVMRELEDDLQYFQEEWK